MSESTFKKTCKKATLISNLEVVQKIESMLNKEVEHLLINNDQRPE